MRNRIARRCSRWTLPALALLTLSACAHEPETVFRDQLVEVPVPVVQRLPERLTRDCEPRTGVPFAGALTVADVLERLAAVEDALAVCRAQAGELRAVGP